MDKHSVSRVLGVSHGSIWAPKFKELPAYRQSVHQATTAVTAKVVSTPVARTWTATAAATADGRRIWATSQRASSRRNLRPSADHRVLRPVAGRQSRTSRK